MQKTLETSTIFFTPSGEVEVRGPDVSVEMQATARSNVAPLWLVFPEHIINTSNITAILRIGGGIHINTRDEKEYRIFPVNMDKTWSALQKVFAEGVPDE